MEPFSKNIELFTENVFMHAGLCVVDTREWLGGGRLKAEGIRLSRD